MRNRNFFSRTGVATIEYVLMASVFLWLALGSGFVPKVRAACDVFFNRAVTAMR